MADSEVVTLSRFAQWRTDSLENTSSRKSDPFKMGIWNWCLSVDRSHCRYRQLTVRLSLVSSDINREKPPFARFVMRISTPGHGRQLVRSQEHEREFLNAGDFVWHVGWTFHGRIVIDVEFLDLKICSLNAKEGAPIWIGRASEIMQSMMIQSTHHCLSRMLEEAIHFDVTINASDGSLKAHKAVLCANSPVFHSMFHHDLKEKESSVIYIGDMSIESCATLLNYLYGTIKEEDFWKHRLALLEAANKYGIMYLKAACEECLLEDINLDNVLERLQKAWLYQLDKLKNGCLKFLFEFGRAYDIREEINNLFMHVDRELIRNMFQEMLITVWKPMCDLVDDQPLESETRYSNIII